ncbi:hypothetical protein JL720_51 [Aureococcus anophagefferens]|nr:hypothetical protein JL720_51 [Aureococcus anophagefferens]
MEKRRRASRTRRSRRRAPLGGSKRSARAPAHVNLVDDPANAEPAFTFPSAKAPDAITCLKGDRLRLQDGEFLNDNLINLYLKNKMHNQLASVVSVRLDLLLHEDARGRGVPGSFDAKKAYAKVKRWTKNADVFDQDLLFVPANEHLHWSLAVVVNPGKKPSRRTPRAKPKPKKGDVIEIDSDSDGDGDDADATPDPRRASSPWTASGPTTRAASPSTSARSSSAPGPTATPRDLDGRFEAETMPIFAPDLPKQRNSFDCGVYVLKFFDLLFDKPLPARAADDDMTFGDRFSKQLFKREDVKAKRAKLLHFFDLEWEKAMRAKEAELPEAKAPEAADDDDVADSDATESMPDARAADAATASDDLAGALAKAQAPPRQSFRDGASMPDCLPPAKRQRRASRRPPRASHVAAEAEAADAVTPPASDDDVDDDDFDENATDPIAPAPAPPRRGGDDEAAPRSKDVWNAGSIFVGDHAMVHAGPRDAIRDPASPRVVLFTTSVVSDGGGPGASYDVRDQYMPYFLAEDETMPPERAWALLNLKEWKKEEPWSHYPGDKKSKAVRRLATSPVLPPATVVQLVGELRAPED